MAWIELHQSLPTHRKTMALMDALDIDVACAVGHLACLWLWGLDNAPDGVLRVSARTVARAAHWQGDPDAFVAALEAAEFLDNGTIHDWDDFAGKLIDRRRQNAERMREARAAHAPSINSVTCNERAEHVQRTSTARAGATVPNPTVPNRTPPDRTEPTKGVAPDADAPAAPLALRAAPKPAGASDHQALWDTFTELFGTARSQKERDKRGKACREARESSPPIKPEEVLAAAENWPNVMGDATMSELAIVANLGKLLEGPQRNGRSNGTVRGLKQTVYESAAIHHRPSVADLRKGRTDGRE